MDQKFLHGNIRSLELARIIGSHFNRGNLRVQIIGDENRSIVQIGTHSGSRTDGQTALSIILQRAADGVSIQVGRQGWVGIAASLGVSAQAVIRNPFNLIGRLDDIAQDIEYLELTEEVWRLVDGFSTSANGSNQLSVRRRRIDCVYCHTANPPSEPNCIACGSPLGGVQPRTCRRCGFVVTRSEKTCPNCKSTL